MRFYWQLDRHTKDVRFGAPLRGLVYNNHRPKKCLILTEEVDSYLNKEGMGEYIAYKMRIKEQLTPKGIIDTVEKIND